MRCAIFVSIIGVVAAGCSKKSQDGLPPATEWQLAPSAESNAGTAAAPRRMGQMGALGRRGAVSGNPHAGMDMSGDSSDPHAGLDMSGDPTNPHAGMDMSDPSNPHAGVDMSNPHAGMDMSDPSNPHAGVDMSNPHAGVDMNNPHAGGTDVTKLGFSAPDPDRPLDPNHRITGVITVDAKAKDRVKPGTPVFLIVKRPGPDGAPSGPPLAVDKLTWSGGDVPFELTDAQAMIKGTDLSGEVVVMARYDQDSDASTKQPGDVTGQVTVKIPADHVKVTLDTILP